jgi:hypothetical protein
MNFVEFPPRGEMVSTSVETSSVETFSLRWKPFHRGGSLSTEVEASAPRR